MRKLKKPVKLILALTVSLFLFFMYIHSTKNEVIASVAMESNKGVAVNLQNPYIMPIKVYDTAVVDSENNELPTTAYSIVLNGVYSGNGASVDESFMKKQTEVFEKLDEVTIPSDTAKLERNYSIFLTQKEQKEAKKISVSFKIFYLIPFKSTVYL